MPVVIEAVCCCSTKDYYFTDIYTQWRLWCHAIAISYDPRTWKNTGTLFEILAVDLRSLSSLCPNISLQAFNPIDLSHTSIDCANDLLYV